MSKLKMLKTNIFSLHSFNFHNAQTKAQVSGELTGTDGNKKQKAQTKVSRKGKLIAG